MAAPPAGGRANDALLHLLAATLAIPRGDLTLVAGHTSRRKVLEVLGLDAAELGRRLEAAALRR